MVVQRDCLPIRDKQKSKTYKIIPNKTMQKPPGNRAGYKVKIKSWQDYVSWVRSVKNHSKE